MSILLGMPQDLFFAILGILFVLLVVTERIRNRSERIEVEPPPKAPERPRKGRYAPSDPERFRE